jgi:hypothetical protein
MACAYCNMNMHDICAAFDNDPCCCGGRGFQGESATVLDALTGKATWQKDRALMADPTSTGRKRAAVVIPDEILNDSLICEWAGLLYAGGGVDPIVGCNGRIASDRHHGPDKCVLNNERGVNLWAICDHCHNRWHALNDKYYVPDGWRSAKLDGDPRPKNGDPWLPNPEYEWQEPDLETKADPQLIQLHEAWWLMSSYQRNEMLGGNFREYAKRFAFSGEGQHGGPDDVQHSDAGSTVSSSSNGGRRPAGDSNCSGESLPEISEAS